MDHVWYSIAIVAVIVAFTDGMVLQYSKLSLSIICAMIEVLGYSQPAGVLINDETAVPFLRFVPDSRGVSLGGTGLATSPDAYSSYYNPAKLSSVPEKYHFSVSYVPLIRAMVPDVNMTWFSASTRIDAEQAVGMSLQHISWGEGNVLQQSNVRLNEFSINLAYSRKLSDRLSGGLSMKYIGSRSLRINLLGLIQV